eukprot:5010880-Amphidinium_carterae.1
MIAPWGSASAVWSPALACLESTWLGTDAGLTWHVVGGSTLTRFEMLQSKAFLSHASLQTKGSDAGLTWHVVDGSISYPFRNATNQGVLVPCKLANQGFQSQCH